MKSNIKPSENGELIINEYSEPNDQDTNTVKPFV